MSSKKGQISMEYLIVMGFITFVIIGMLGFSFYYIGGMRDRIKFNQIETFADKVISSSETVYYSGKPSKLTVNVYLPDGVSAVTIYGNELRVNISSDSGTNTRVFSSKVNINGTISSNEGIKKLVISAQDSQVDIQEG